MRFHDVYCMYHPHVKYVIFPLEMQLSLDTNGIQGWGRCADGERLKGHFIEKLFIEVTTTKPLSKETSIDLSGWMNVFVPDGENQVNDFNNGTKHDLIHLYKLIYSLHYVPSFVGINQWHRVIFHPNVFD